MIGTVSSYVWLPGMSKIVQTSHSSLVYDKTLPSLLNLLLKYKSFVNG